MKKLSKLFPTLLISLMASSLFAANWKVKVPADAKRFPLIKIVSTENGGKNATKRLSADFYFNNKYYIK